jgi:phosphoenolpyruvate synthase/pyruvate phosphate dikinase
MDGYVLDLEAVDRTMVGLVGGKAASLGELTRVEGVHVPAGFCVTTEAFRAALAGASSIDEGTAIPDDVAAAITAALSALDDGAFAVRSSSTAEDAPTASFAGQHASYLNVVGQAAVLAHVRLCWASLYSEEAVAYRRRNGLDDGAARMAVVVQRMVHARAAGVLFTADPLGGDRTLAMVEATLGLGDALVSGRVNADVYRVRDGEVVEEELGAEPALSGKEAVRLARLGRRIEAHFGCPQDIEWCLAGDGFQVVQSRPITTLFPVPASDDGERHVYISVGHQQMMTDAMKPLGISVRQLTSPRPMAVAGGRLFADATRLLATDSEEVGFVQGWERTDPLVGSALRRIVERPGFLPAFPEVVPGSGMPLGGAPSSIETDPAIVAELVAESEASLATLEREIAKRSGAALVDFVLADFEELRRILFAPRSMQAIMAGMEATQWLNDELEAWLGEKGAGDTLTQSLPDNVTAEMGLALLDVADAIRPHPEVVAFLREVRDDGFLDELPGVPGGVEARDAVVGFLDRYGMRCVGEIDITRPRWSERPATLVPVLLSDVENFEAGAGARRFRLGLEKARAKEREVLERLRALPDGEAKAAEAKRMIDRARTFNGYREYPKFGMVSRYMQYKRALWEEAARLVRAGVLAEEDDVSFLTLEELRDAFGDDRVDASLIRRRREEYETFRALTPPRVMTSDGEIVTGSYRHADVPAGALVGLPVSTGTVEGRARVIEDIADADLEPGDILVTAFTDPSWTPLFVTAAALVTEVGGLMTHGAVIAREYGLPAVVGVEGATELIEDGRRIRVHGAEGYVELLDQSPVE